MLNRFIFEHTPIRGNLVNLEHTFQQALAKQKLPKSLKKIMGELMAASALLAATLKMQGALVLQIQSRDKVRLIVVECTSDFGIRATAKYDETLAEDSDIIALIKHGQFMVILDPKDGGQVYQGIVPFEGESISALLENYMLRSEQIDTKIWLSCNSQTAAGMLIQKLPNTTHQQARNTDELQEDAETWNRIGYLAQTLTNEELLNLPAQTILTRLFHEEEVRLFEASQTNFFCSCSRENVANMLRMLGQDEVNSVLEEQGKIEVNCDFCNAHYQFDQVDAAQLMASEVSPKLSKEVH